MSEEKIFCIISSLVFATLIAICIAASSCNSSDNITKVKMAEAGCDYVGNGVFICREKKNQ